MISAWLSRRSSQAAAGVAGATWLGSVALLLWWLRNTPTDALREQLKVWQVWSLDGCALLAVVFAIYSAAALTNYLTRSDVVRIAVVAGVATGLTLLAAPRTNRIFYDEQIYQSIGHNIADLRLAQRCNDGDVEGGRLRCRSGEYNKQPYAYPHVLSLAYAVFGVTEETAFAVNAAAMAATVTAVYLLAIVLFANRDAAFFSSVLLAFTPQQVAWSATAAVEPTASLGVVVAVLAAAHYLRSGHRSALGLAVALAAYAIQFRPESLLALAVILTVIWPRLRSDLERPRGWWAAILFLWLVAAHAAHLVAVRSIDWGTAGPRFSFDFVGTNAAVNIPFYLYDERFPGTMMLLALVGLSSTPERLGRVAMALWFFVFFTIVLFFYAGSYDFGADVRYSVMTYPPLAVLGGLGLSRLVRLVHGPAAGAPLRYAIAAILGFQFLWYAPSVRSTEEAWAARADVRFARSYASELPRDAYVLTHNPDMFHLWGVNAGQMSRVVDDPAYAAVLARMYPGGLYLHWNFWCNVDDELQREFCQKARSMGRVDLVTQYSERGQVYGFYRLHLTNEP